VTRTSRGPRPRLATVVALVAALAPRAARGQAPPAIDRLLDRAADHYLKGERREAYDDYREALRLVEGSTDRPSALLCTLNLSSIAADLGRYDESEAFARRALAESIALGDGEAQSMSENNLGRAFQYLGKKEEATAHYRAALALNLERGSFESAVTNLDNLGVVAFDSSRLGDAMGLYRRAITTSLEHAGEPWAKDQARVALANLGAVFEKSGEREHARVLYECLLRDESEAPDRRAAFRNSLGRVLIDLGDPERALGCFEEAAKEFEACGDSGAESNALLHLGATLCLSFRRHADAQHRFARALELATKISDRNEATFDLLYLARCLFHTGDLEASRARYLEAEQASRDCGSLEGRWTALFGMAKVEEAGGRVGDALARVLEGLALLESVRDARVPEAFRAGFLEDQAEACAAAVRLELASSRDAASEPRRVAEAFRLAERFRARSFLDRLHASPRSLADVQKSLRDADAALVELVASERSLVAFVASADSARVVELAPPADLDRLVDAANRELTHAPSVTESGAVAALSKQVAVPIASALPSGVRRIVVVPDGALCRFPIGALRVGVDGSPPLLLERFATSFAPSASAWCALRERPPASSALDLAAFGDPVLPDAAAPSATAPDDESPAAAVLCRLPFSADEVRRVAALASGAREIRTGEACTAEEFRRLSARRPRVLHLATHTIVDSHPDLSSIVFTPVGAHRSPSVIRASDLPDGISTDLVVLSSCRSGQGRLRRGEGVFGLSRSFVEAGAAAVLGTSWPVEDATSPEFMSRFYEGLAQGLPADEALRDAQLAFARAPGSPDTRAWAGYVLFGDATRVVWRRPAGSRAAIAIAAGAIVAVSVWCASTWGRRRFRRRRRIAAA
jgi:CHAT domain-containing protein/Tfp pilus assembly protein PilF